MNVEEANAIIFRLNAAFNGDGADIPEAGEIHEALESLIEEAATRGGRKDEIPSGVDRDFANINRNTNIVIVGIRDYVNKLIDADEARKALKKKLAALNDARTSLPEIIQKKIKI